MNAIDRIAQFPVSDRKAETSRSSGRCSDQNRGATGRALVAVAEPHEATRSVRRPADRSRAAFVAQLIAVNQHLPQTRERRRAAPGEAVAAYVAAVHASAGRPGFVCAREA